jgi:GNAT superfamily N-acetyltransferase
VPSPSTSGDVRPVTGERLDDLAALFATNGTTRGCWCMFFLTSGRKFEAGWGQPNRARFEEFAASADPPAGLLAYRDAEPVGWCAAGPRARYPRALRSPVLKGREPAEDLDVWLVPCFFVRRDARGQGITQALLTAAVDLAREYGATAVEGFPLAGGDRHPGAEAYLGVEPVFAASGFRVVARPTPRRVVMRRSLSR